MNERLIQGIGMTSQRTRGRLIERLKSQGITNTRVLSVIRDTPRHLFVDEALASRAYEDSALPIGFSQTISQPYIVARMTELLLSDGIKIERVLEVGTGCGYQTSILSQLVARVYTVERIEGLLKQAQKRFRLLKLKNIHSRHSDGAWGWKSEAPYDGILVTAAPESIPEALLQQLAAGGRLIIPIGEYRRQELVTVNRTENGFEKTVHEPVSFVPFLAGES